MSEISDRLREICRIGQGADCCRYVVAGADGITCAKGVPELAKQINARVADGLFTARADNCPGLPPGERI